MGEYVRAAYLAVGLLLPLLVLLRMVHPYPSTQDLALSFLLGMGGTLLVLLIRGIGTWPSGGLSGAFLTAGALEEGVKLTLGLLFLRRLEVEVRNDERITREALYELVWSEPMLRVAERYRVSSSFMARVCQCMGVPRPPRGHWAKLSHGKPSPKPPLPALGPGMRESWRRGERVDMGGARSLPKPPARSRRLKAVVRDGPGPHPVLAGAKEGSIVVDMTTSEPSLAQEIAEKAKQKGVAALDAPVSGGDVGAREGTLAIMVGGDRALFDEVLPLFQLMGKNIAYQGPAGAGQHTKMCNQILIASTMIGVVESLIYGYKAGLDQNDVINVIGKGAASSWSINNLGPRIVNGNFDPGFFIKHFVKDMGIALDEAKRMKISLPGLALAQQFYLAAMAQGYENLGTHGLYKVIASMNGVDA